MMYWDKVNHFPVISRIIISEQSEPLTGLLTCRFQNTEEIDPPETPLKPDTGPHEAGSHAKAVW